MALAPLVLPMRGVNTTSALRDLRKGETPAALNALGYDLKNEIGRPTKRPGLTRKFGALVNGSNPVRTIFSSALPRRGYELTDAGVNLFADDFNRADEATSGGTLNGGNWFIRQCSATFAVSDANVARTVTTTATAAAADEPRLSGGGVICSHASNVWACIVDTYDVPVASNRSYTLEIEFTTNALASSSGSSIVGFLVKRDGAEAYPGATGGFAAIEITENAASVGGTITFYAGESMLARYGANTPVGYHDDLSFSASTTYTLRAHLVNGSAGQTFLSLYLVNNDAALEVYRGNIATSDPSNQSIGFVLMNVDSAAPIVRVDNFRAYEGAYRDPDTRKVMFAEAGGSWAHSVDGATWRTVEGPTYASGATFYPVQGRAMGFVTYADPGATLGRAEDLWFYYTDGVRYGKIDPRRLMLREWAGPAAIGVPGRSVPKIAVLWQSRAILSGYDGEPFNVYGSELATPEGWTIGSGATDAWAFEDTVGLVPDAVTCLAPADKDYLFVGGLRSMFLLRGDPNGGGVLTDVSSEVGVFGRFAWCRDDAGRMYFVGERGLYQMGADGVPRYISEGRQDAFFEGLDPMSDEVALVWDDWLKAIHVNVLRDDGTTPDGLIWLRGSDSFWPTRYGDQRHPCSMHFTYGVGAAEGRMLLGGQDGWVRATDPDVNSDDGLAIESSLDLPPLFADNERDALLSRLGAILSRDTDALSYDVRAAGVADDLATADPKFSGTWTGGGRKAPDLRCAAGAAIKVTVRDNSATNRWALEHVGADFKIGDAIGGFN